MSSVNILIADDHELFRRTVRSFIEAQPDYRVCGEAGDGIEAVEKVRQLRPDVVLMDINMPRMDGLEATRIIRREVPECNVIIVTQNHATIAREQARMVDAKGSVTKSDLTRELISTIDKLFGNAKPEAQRQATNAPVQERPPAGGALGKLVDDFDWAKTPLGAIDKWPHSLKNIVRVMLTSRFAMWMSWGPELTFLYNDAYAKMSLGKKHPWALGKPSRVVWEEIWSDIGPRIRRVLDTGEATWDEALLLFLERSGYREETYHTFSYSPLSGDDGKISGHLCVVTEETDRVIGERRLRTLRSLATELSKTITEQDVFESVQRLLGDNQQDLPFTLTYLLSDDGKQARLSCQTGLAAGHAATPEVIELSDPGSKWPLAALLDGKDSVMVDDLAQRFHSVPSGAWDISPGRALLLPVASALQGNPAGVFIAALNPYRPLDVSYAGFLNLVAGQIASSVANARAYEDERKRAEALAELDRAKTIFFSNVSHEFRTPLTLMLGPLEDALASPSTLPQEHRERLEVAHRNSVRLLRLVNNLLDFSRIEAGRIQASYEPTDLGQFTTELASLFGSATDRAGLKLVIRCAEIDGPVYVDREMWEKIVLNLLSNAFKFTFDGEIEVSLKKVDGQVELSVRDTGTGIPQQEIPHLFERFYRVKSAHGRTFEGSGIGLALVQELARLHGGSVSVRSEVNQGSTFTVSIPLGKEHLPPDRISAERSVQSTRLRGEAYVQEALRWLPGSETMADEISVSALLSSADSIRHRRESGAAALILLADDNADMREYVTRLLSEQYEVVAVADGEAALSSARDRRPDLILSDVMMPKLDGFGLLQAVRGDESLRSTPLILLSARAGEESRIEGLQSGADDYLVKPFSARELLARVKAHLDMARIRRKAAETERDLREEAAEKARMADVNFRLMKIQDEERRRIARELHDSAGQTLTILGMNLAQVAQKAQVNASDFANELESIQRTVQQLHREIRTTSYLLHPPLLDENGLGSALGWYVDGLRERSNLDIRLDIPQDFPRLPRDLELVIFRVVQECLTNIHRHAESKTASIRMAQGSNQVMLEIGDQGKGMAPERLAEIQSGRSGVGIRGMKERLRRFDGTMEISSDKSGTRILVTIPVPEAALQQRNSNIEPLQTAV